MTESQMSSRMPGFYNKTFGTRLDEIAKRCNLTDDEVEILNGEAGLTVEQADHMIENVVGIHALPLGIAVNFIVNGRDVLVPMAVEEPSIVAGASFMAKLVRAGGGFHATSTPPEMIVQLQVLDLPDLPTARAKILEKKDYLLSKAAEVDPILQKLGGGPRDLVVRILDETPIGPFLVVHLIYDVRDAMGANALNTAGEKIAPILESISGGRVNLRILSNLADRRITLARCTVPLESLAFGDFQAEQVRDGILEAWAFAAADPYRAATHNKGIMNGVDPIVIATGNDWRAVEAGAHAYAARNGHYTSLSTWGKDDKGNLVGTLEMPMAVGIVGGATKVHPTAKVALKILGVKTAQELAEVIVSVGLAQNLAALRALATEGIQRGHMSLHARQVAVAAGATGEEIERLAERLVNDGVVRIDHAKEVLFQWKREK